MAGSVNKVILLGRLGKDPESRSFPNGGKLVSFTLATSESWRDKASGERKERTDWHQVVITNEALAKIAEQYLRKGSQVYVEGQLQTRKWQDQAGNDRYTTEVCLRPFAGSLTLLDKRQDDDRGDGRSDYAAPAPGGSPAGGGYDHDDDGPDIPF